MDGSYTTTLFFLFFFMSDFFPFSFYLTFTNFMCNSEIPSPLFNFTVIGSEVKPTVQTNGWTPKNRPSFLEKFFSTTLREYKEKSVVYQNRLL